MPWCLAQVEKEWLVTLATIDPEDVIFEVDGGGAIGNSSIALEPLQDGISKRSCHWPARPMVQLFALLFAPDASPQRRQEQLVARRSVLLDCLRQDFCPCARRLAKQLKEEQGLSRQLAFCIDHDPWVFRPWFPHAVMEPLACV